MELKEVIETIGILKESYDKRLSNYEALGDSITLIKDYLKAQEGMPEKRSIKELKSYRTMKQYINAL